MTPSIECVVLKGMLASEMRERPAWEQERERRGSGKKNHRGLETPGMRAKSEEGARSQSCSFTLLAEKVKLEPEQNMQQKSCEGDYECP